MVGHLLDVPSFNVDQTVSDGVSVDWSSFRQWVFSKYAKTYAPTVVCYAKKYVHLLRGNLREIDLLKPSAKIQTVKALAVLSKFLGVHKEFKNRLSDYGIKMPRPDAFSSFLRIMNKSQQ